MTHLRYILGLSLALVLGAGLGYPPPISAEVIFTDDFSSGDLSKSLGSASWGHATRVDVSGAQNIVGPSSAARFTFEGSSDLSRDAMSELRFDLGKIYQEVWIQYYLYVPSNYYHRDASGSDNNKMLRIWGQNYSDGEKVGLSTWPESSGASRVMADWSLRGQSIGQKGDRYSSFISSSDRGKWMKIRVQVSAARSTGDYGTIRVWKNDELVINNYQTVDNYHSGEPHGYRYGYLLGWSNSGFNETTLMYIDGVTFATSVNDLDGGADVKAPPMPPEIQVN